MPWADFDHQSWSTTNVREKKKRVAQMQGNLSLSPRAKQVFGSFQHLAAAFHQGDRTAGRVAVALGQKGKCDGEVGSPNCVVKIPRSRLAERD